MHEAGESSSVCRGLAWEVLHGTELEWQLCDIFNVKDRAAQPEAQTPGWSRV